jgi:hypothetical protein
LNYPHVGCVAAASGAIKMYGGQSVKFLFFSAYDGDELFGAMLKNFAVNGDVWG